MRLLIVFISLFMLLFACTTPQEHGRASELSSQFHERWSGAQWDSLLSLYDSAFLASQGRDSWLNRLQQYHQKLGTIKQVELVDSSIDARYSGDYYIYRFLLTFERGQLRETMTIYQQLNQDDMLVVGHMIKSVGKQ